MWCFRCIEEHTDTSDSDWSACREILITDKCETVCISAHETHLQLSDTHHGETHIVHEINVFLAICAVLHPSAHHLVLIRTTFFVDQIYKLQSAHECTQETQQSFSVEDGCICCWWDKGSGNCRGTWCMYLSLSITSTPVEAPWADVPGFKGNVRVLCCLC